MMEVSEDSNDINDPAEPQESQNADANHETEFEKPSDQVQQLNSTLDNEIEDVTKHTIHPIYPSIKFC